MTASVVYPAAFATNVNFSAGPDVSTPVKIDPASPTDGFYRGMMAAPQHQNFLHNQWSRAARFSVESAVLYSWSPLLYEGGPPTTVGMAAVWDPVLFRTMLCKGGGNGTHVVSEDLLGITVNDAGTVTPVRDAARDPSAGTVVVVGTGGAFAARSTNFGTSWSDAGTPPTAKDRVVWDVTNGLFIASRTGSSNLHTSPTGATWTSRALSASCEGGLAVRTNGIGLAGIGTGASTAFNVSSNGTAWSLAAGTIPDVASASSDGGSLCMNGGYFFHAHRFSSGAEIRVFRSLDSSAAWTLMATIVPPASVGSGSVKILSDDYSGALYLLGGPSGSTYVWASLDGGSTWFGPARLAAAGTGIQAAGGRVWANKDEFTRATNHRLTPAT